jgi:hypothetical protein
VGEQLAYIAALAVRADVIYGDVPKAETYARLNRLPILQLDAAFGTQARPEAADA